MFQSFIGLEIHIQLLTRSKVFCGCKAAFGEEPNSNVCPICMGYPGVLPALNEQAIKMAYLVARALDCSLSKQAVFERKNYFYPDLPKNYQISQFSSPVGQNGYMDIEFRRRKKKVSIREVHLEEDAGKMIHAGDISLLDFNRAGTPLLEIVTQPDLEVGEEAEFFLKQLRRLVRYLGVCDGNMEEGSLRCDANISVNHLGRGLGSKVEIKNLNSFKFVRKALNFEIERQQDILARGGSITQETRLWNENRDVTEVMRTKESAHDYRYFPEPDLPSFKPDKAFLKSIETSMIELPNLRRQRLIRACLLTEQQADFICEERETTDFFERALSCGAEPQAAAVWLASDIQKMLNRSGISISESPLTPERFAEMLTLISQKRIHGKIAKQVLEVIFDENKSPERIIKERNWEQITDRKILKGVVDKVLERNSPVVKQITQGDPKPLGYLMGEIMKLTSGRAEPGLVKELLNEHLYLSFIQVLSMGGAITGKVNGAGDISPGDLNDVIRQVEEQGDIPKSIRFEEIEISRILSEEITPEDWSSLIIALDSYLNRGNTSGIVVAHGTDTLAYTASLLFWFFPDPPVPVVLTAALNAEEAAENLSAAVVYASEKKGGIYVSLGKTLLSPLNLKFERIAHNGFKNWNLQSPLYCSKDLSLSLLPLSDRKELTLAIEQAINQVCILKIFPGMRGDYLISLMNTGVKYFILELYDTGTANLRESPYSLKKAFLEGKERGVLFFCTSQQEGIVDFSGYITSHELWREGAIPMGSLTTESTFTRLIVSLLASESDEDLLRLMEEFSEDINFRA